MALAIGRSLSNNLSASAGIVAVIGGPLRTGRRRAIEEVIRTTAPVHEGFSGGALVDVRGGLLGIATSTAIRGTTVVIPAAIAWRTAASVLEHGRLKRGYLGIAGQPARLPDHQRTGDRAVDRTTALLVVAVTDGSPAAAGGVMVGDVLTDFDGEAVEAPEDLLDRLVGDRVGRQVTLRVLRGGAALELPVTVGERPNG
jgi:S1-C subfamily serine protease